MKSKIDNYKSDKISNWKFAQIIRVFKSHLGIISKKNWIIDWIISLKWFKENLNYLFCLGYLSIIATSKQFGL